MAFTTLISATELANHYEPKQWVIVDCRFSLADITVGATAYRHGHLPQARYADLHNDLSAAVTDLTGRHPLPNFKQLTQKLGQWGVGNHTQVVAYDDAGGAFAGRLWWLLRCLGHENVAVLNGGLKAWLQQGYTLTTALPQITPKSFRGYLNETLWLTALDVENALARRAVTLIDARTPERYRGEQEPIDPIAGHIPYALNRPFQLNLNRDGLFLPPDVLKQQFKRLINNRLPSEVVHYCGSGVTACHNVLAMEVAGLNGSKLYAGSWSEWIRNKNRTVCTA